MTIPGPQLVLAGRLETIPLADVLQLLAASGRDGVLVVEHEDPPEHGEIELAGGRVVRAEVRHLSEKIGTLLLRRRKLDPDALGEALRRQSAACAWKPIGTVLLEMGAIEPGALAEALVDQINEHAAVLMTWDRGVFRFRVPTGAEAERRSGRGLVGVGIDARELLLEAARRCDEAALVN